MTHHQRRSRTRACRYKVKIETDKAQEYLLAAQKDTTRYHDNQNLELYFCSCGFFHIGHKLGSRKKANTNPVVCEEKVCHSGA